ncbi:MAG: type I 3-dehydroquinate dehydratase, partial [Acidobacteriota bacterium]|nr:type I 3-dehydroquinate dehydratase [Acidobacteriota bacterium]
MNNGKICVSVCAANANEMLEQIRRAEKIANIIEIRLDCIEPKQIFKVFAFLGSKKPLILTYRPKEQGGKVEADLFQRKMIWNAFVINGDLDRRKLWFDFEYD